MSENGTRRYWKQFLIAAGTAVLLLTVCALLLWNGILRFNYPSHTKFPVHGVDVSSWQGDIDWTVLADQDIGFAFIKATEGSTFVDPQFAANWAGAHRTSLRVGAYHFFSYDSAGETQAENFIKTVPIVESALPPVVDIEFYSDKAANPPPKSAVTPVLDALLAELEQHYGKKPILYATAKSYRLYLQDGYRDNPIWIRNIFTTPTLPDRREWVFWQYSNRGRLAGYRGREKFIDLNVYRGTEEEFRNL